jgi:DNA (cytosine-5)-methyltransferase 1
VKGAYYNEHEPFAAEWLRRLIAKNLIAAGEVDERDIQDVRADELREFQQHHFFAGIGTWSYALRCAGWSDDRPVITGSCPCQPFSVAGSGKGTSDERHLWPDWFKLLKELRPSVIFGEQVASPIAISWFDTVSNDLEGEGYAVGAADLCASSVGAPHIRQRLFFVATIYGIAVPAGQARCHGARPGLSRCGDGNAPHGNDVGGCRSFGGVAHLCGEGLEVKRVEQTRGECSAAERGGEIGRLGDPSESGSRRDAGAIPREETGSGQEREAIGGVAYLSLLAGSGFWSDVVWLPCSDGKARPIKSGIEPLAHGVTGRVGLLRAYGNSIVAPLATEFVRAAMDVLKEGTES